MVGAENFEKQRQDNMESNNSTEFHESWKDQKLNGRLNEPDGAMKFAEASKNSPFEEKIGLYKEKGEKIKYENDAMKNFKDCPATAVDVTKWNWEKPDKDIVDRMSKMAKNIEIEDPKFDNKLINRWTGGTIAADLQWKIWDEKNTVTYLSDCSYWNSFSNEKCLIHSYGDPVYYAEPPVNFS